MMSSWRGPSIRRSSELNCALTGIPVTDERSARKAVDILLELGVKQVFLSMGSAGVLYGNARGKKRIPNYPAEVRNTTGAGDSFMELMQSATEAFSI